MIRKLLVCVMAVTLAGCVLTASAYFAADSVLVVDPADGESASGTFGVVSQGDVVDIPEDLLESSQGESSVSAEGPQVSSSGETSAIVSPSVVPSNSSTVTIPSDLSPSVPSTSSSHSSSEPSTSGGSETTGSSSGAESSSESQPPAPTGETLIVKISSEPEVGIYEVNDILPRIVAMEMDNSFADEALKAQAVATHSYIKYQNSIGKAPVVAVRTPTARIQSLVESVSSEMVYYNGQVINAAYTASMGGRSEDSREVWGGYLPYLTSVESVYDSYDPNWGYQTVYTVDQVKTMVKQNAGIELTGDPSQWFKLVSTTMGGYNGDMTIGGHSTFTYNGKTYKVTGRNIQTIIMKGSGLPTLRSHKFDVSVSGNNIIFTTYGYGHGVGMSQWGAHYYASMGGYSYKQILTHYYSGTSVY